MTSYLLFLQSEKSINSFIAIPGKLKLVTPLIARLIGPTWGPCGANRTQVGPMLAPWALLSIFAFYLCIAAFKLRDIFRDNNFLVLWKIIILLAFKVSLFTASQSEIWLKSCFNKTVIQQMSCSLPWWMNIESLSKWHHLHTIGISDFYSRKTMT